ncbi:SAM-dependent methyltransferase [uncultured Sphingomonas sp.]|uniref:SAM-dependent methyltransferase n=1 Tax=uncultured Sphingomonas sp. TaxID=158754 RepID=UPI0035CA1C26
MAAIDLSGFADKFRADADPWATFSNADEALKRRAILRALGPGPWGRVLELGAGNGSNSAALADRALRLDATEGTWEGTTLVAKALDGRSRTRASVLAVPGRFPRSTYDALVVAELLYYLSPRAMAATARDVAAALRPGGRLVLAHHRIDYYDFAQHADGIHGRFLTDTRTGWRTAGGYRTGRWIVSAWIRA